MASRGPRRSGDAASLVRRGCVVVGRDHDARRRTVAGASWVRRGESWATMRWRRSVATASWMRRGRTGPRLAATRSRWRVVVVGRYSCPAFLHQHPGAGPRLGLRRCPSFRNAHRRFLRGGAKKSGRHSGSIGPLACAPTATAVAGGLFFRRAGQVRPLPTARFEMRPRPRPRHFWQGAAHR